MPKSSRSLLPEDFFIVQDLFFQIIRHTFTQNGRGELFENFPIQQPYHPRLPYRYLGTGKCRAFLPDKSDAKHQKARHPKRIPLSLHTSFRSVTRSHGLHIPPLPCPFALVATALSGQAPRAFLLHLIQSRRVPVANGTRPGFRIIHPPRLLCLKPVRACSESVGSDSCSVPKTVPAARRTALAPRWRPLRAAAR